MLFFEKLIGAAQSAFLEVGVFVGVVLLVFGYFNYKTQGRFVQKLENTKRLQPVFGALLGLTPGCGGAIFVMPLYLKGSVTFGTVISTLIATMGDAAFVLISTRPIAFIIISAISFVLALISGYAVDALKIDGGFSKRREKLLKNAAVPADVHAKLHSCPAKHVGHANGDSLDMILHHSKKQSHEKHTAMLFTHKIACRVFWALIGIGLVLGILLLADIDINTALCIPNIGVYIGVAGIFFSVLYMIATKRIVKNEGHETSEHKLSSIRETLIHNAEDTAFVCLWVFVAHFIYECAVILIGGEAVVAGWISTTGLSSVIAGVLIGLIPGCGPQVIFVSLYARGILPFSALLANSISQDGDALFPLLAIDSRSSLYATIITAIPAVIAGIAAYFIEMLIKSAA